MSPPNQRIGGSARIDPLSMISGLDPEQIAAIRAKQPIPPSAAWLAANQPTVEPLERPVRPRRGFWTWFKFEPSATSLVAQINARFKTLQELDCSPEPPLVSAVMVCNQPGRLKLTRKAVDRFLLQTYQNKQLVIVNGSGTPVTNVPHQAIHEVSVPSGMTLGSMRNAGIDAVDGAWIMHWDDDDHHDPHRISYQMAHRREGMASLLTHQVRCHCWHGTAYLHNEPAGIPGTVLFPKGRERYQDLDTFEDLAFRDEHWAARSVLLRNSVFPATVMVVAIFHGNNRLPIDQFMVGHDQDAMKGRLLLPEPEIAYLARVLKASGLEVAVRQPAPLYD